MKKFNTYISVTTFLFFLLFTSEALIADILLANTKETIKIIAKDYENYDFILNESDSLLLNKDGSYIGYIQFSQSYSHPVLEIEQLNIEKSFRGKKYSKVLMEIALKVAIRLNFQITAFVANPILFPILERSKCKMTSSSSCGRRYWCPTEKLLNIANTLNL